MSDNGSSDGNSLGVDGREALYQALSTIEDSLTDGYHSHRPVPDFAPAESGQLENRQPEFNHTPQPQATRQQATRQQASRAVAGQARDPQMLASIASELVRCRACRLAITRKQVVPGTSPAGANLFILGEYPADEDKAGLPFSLEAGQLMARMLAAIGLDRSRDCMETTAVKCRPPMDRGPAPDELAACLPFLERQILAAQPTAILAFGRISAQILLGSREALPSFRGKIHEWRGIPLVVSYHPEAILKDESLKRPAWEDLKLLKTIIGNA